MINGVISKQDTQRMILILAAIKMLHEQAFIIRDEMDLKNPNSTLNKIRRELIKEKIDLVESLRRDYDAILAEHGIVKTRKQAA